MGWEQLSSWSLLQALNGGRFRPREAIYRQATKRAHFGLGQDGAAKVIEIAWPSGIHQELDNVKGDQNLRIDEPPAKITKQE